MALTDNGNGSDLVMPVQPMGYGGNYGGGNWGGGFGYGIPFFPMMGGFGGGWGNGFGGDGGWLILLLLLAMGNGGWGGFGGFGGFGAGLGIDFPWLMTGQAGINANTNAGFNNAALASQIGDVRSDINRGFGDTALGIAGVNQNICSSTGQVTQALNSGFAQAELAENARQMANMQQGFNAQTAVTGAITGVSSQLAKCCCDQELATANLSALVQRENCQDREALSNGIRDIITSQAAGVQRILDQMCNDKIDAKNERIAALENQVNMQALAASQTAQTAQLIQDNNAQTRDLINRIAPYPQPSFIVGNPYYSNFGYGWGNNWNNNCGCGCGNNFGGFNGNF